MLQVLWAVMILAGIVFAALTGNLSAVTDAALDSAREAVSLCITMAGVLALWVGLMRIAEHAGIMKAAADKIYPLLHFIFPGIPREHPAMKSIAANCIANFFGLGWAATPAGIQAMKDLDALEEERRAAASGIGKKQRNRPAGKKGKGERWGKREKPASSEMCAFLVLNISSLQLIPVTVIAFRSQYGSPDPSGITGAAILATFISTMAAILFIKIMTWRDR